MIMLPNTFQQITHRFKNKQRIFLIGIHGINFSILFFIVLDTKIDTT